jgi:hypothetical protein
MHDDTVADRKFSCPGTDLDHHSRRFVPRYRVRVDCYAEPGLSAFCAGDAEEVVQVAAANSGGTDVNQHLTFAGCADFAGLNVNDSVAAEE